MSRLEVTGSSLLKAPVRAVTTEPRSHREQTHAAVVPEALAGLQRPVTAPENAECTFLTWGVCAAHSSLHHKHFPGHVAHHLGASSENATRDDDEAPTPIHHFQAAGDHDEDRSTDDEGEHHHPWRARTPGRPITTPAELGTLQADADVTNDRTIAGYFDKGSDEVRAECDIAMMRYNAV